MHRAAKLKTILFGIMVPLMLNAQPQEVVCADFTNSVYLGKWNGFYRGTQLQGHLTSLRQGLVTVPPYLMKTSFPYRKRPASEEILFADTISIVRFCGGYQKVWAKQSGFDDPESLDLAYLDKDGHLQYRFEWVAKRLDPYLQAGYRDIILSLDNVPYAMQAYASQGAYGQIAPPRDYDEWSRFIEALCNHLVDLYGFDLPNSWTFRMGTENNGQKPGAAHTFDGTHEQWIKWYDYTSAAVKKVLPGAKFGPGEFGGFIDPGGVEKPRVDYVELVKHCAEGTNYATGKIGAPLDFIANSSHSAPRYENGKLFGCAWPGERVQWNRDSYRNMIGGYTQYANLPIYIFQFGILCSEQLNKSADELPLEGGVGKVLVTCEPGGRGAAWTFQTLVGMKEQVPRIKGIWNWGVLESFKGGLDGSAEKSSGDVSRSLLKSNGWLYSILDYCQGGDAYVLNTPVSEDGTVYKILFSVRDGQTYLIASAFNADRSNFAPRTVSVRIPQSLLPPRLAASTVGQVEINEQNCLYRQIRNDFEKQKLLRPGYAGYSLLAGIYEITPPEKRADVIKCLQVNFPKYEDLMIDSLTLKPFAGTVERSGADCVLTFDIIPGSVKALALKPGREE